MKAYSPSGSIPTRTTLGKLSLLAVLIFTLASCVHQFPRSNGTITEKVIEAYGGRERLEKVVSVAAEGRITALVRGDEGIYKRTFRRDGKLFLDITYNRSTERRILNGPKGFRGTGEQVEEVFGPRYLAMVYQYNELNMPYGLLDNSFTVTELRRETLNNADVHVLRCVDRAGNEMEVFVDGENYRIVKSIGTFSIGTQSTSLSAEFSDFRIVDGVLFPFRIVNYAGGNKIAEIIITRYLVNPIVDDSLFTP
jgi:hypothetical protein